MWIDEEILSMYRGLNGAVEAVVQPSFGRDWQWKVGVVQNGQREWSLGGAAETRQDAIIAAKEIIALMEYAFESGGTAPCGW
jgi:hypothetical protein